MAGDIANPVASEQDVDVIMDDDEVEHYGSLFSGDSERRATDASTRSESKEKAALQERCCGLEREMADLQRMVHDVRDQYSTLETKHQELMQRRGDEREMDDRVEAAQRVGEMMTKYRLLRESYMCQM